MTWKWVPGMRAKNGVRIIAVDDDGYTTGYHEKQGYVIQVIDGDPDWTDPATIGCLLKQIQNAYSQPSAYVEVRGGRARVCAPVGQEGTITLGPRWTVGGELEALLAAL